tara:strand:- start:431 stop:679 length:249 start_codon:yes stop_codon:yes gene_type:complete
MKKNLKQIILIFMKKYKNIKSIPIFNKIQKVREKNNKNWMDLLRLAYHHDPKNTSRILNRIIKKDQTLIKLAKYFKKNENRK